MIDIRVRLQKVEEDDRILGRLIYRIPVCDSKNLDEVISWTKIDNSSWPERRIIMDLVEEKELQLYVEALMVDPFIIRFPTKESGSSRGTDWYELRWW
jgi:hypothetical protein